MMDNAKQDYSAQGFQTWLGSATPQQIVDIGRTALARVATLDQGDQDHFIQTAQRDPQVAKLFTRVQLPA